MGKTSDPSWQILTLERERRARARRRAVAEAEPPSFGEWLGEVRPEFGELWAYKFNVYIRDVLQEMEDGAFSKLLLFVPPRYGKSQQVTVGYTAYLTEQNPTGRSIIGSYSDVLANEFGGQVREIVDKRVGVRSGSASLQNWKTEAGGGVRSVGIGAGLSGFGADQIIVIDDPIRNREDANSETYREKVWRWWTNVVFTRREPGCKVIIIMTRWAIDDLAGRILAEQPDGWRVVRLPGIAETQKQRDVWAKEHNQPLGVPDPLGRAAGDLLNPERFGQDWIDEQRVTMGMDFEALVQQHPRLESGGLFHLSWIMVVESIPDYVKPKRYVRVWDTAATSMGGDYTAGALMMRDSSGIFWIIDVVMEQLGAGDVERLIEETARKDKEMYGLNEVWVTQEPGSSGKLFIHSLSRTMADIRVRGLRETGSKEVRATPLAGAMENGLVRWLRFIGIQAVKTQVVSFPFGSYDDVVDALSGCFNILAKRSLQGYKARKLRGGI